MSKPEEIKLWCWVLGDPPNRAFIASIKLSDPIYNLQKAIYEQKPSFKGVISIESLEVYKVGEWYCQVLAHKYYFLVVRTTSG